MWRIRISVSAAPGKADIINYDEHGQVIGHCYPVHDWLDVGTAILLCDAFNVRDYGTLEPETPTQKA